MAKVAKKKAPVKKAAVKKAAPKKTKPDTRKAIEKAIIGKVNVKPRDEGDFAQRMKAARAAKRGIVVDVRETLKHKAIAEHKAKIAADPLPVQDGKPNTTMARSYVRSGSAGKGKKRGVNFQATVSFTEQQMNAVVAKAEFRQVSLAEMIRSCVVENLGIVSEPAST